MLVVPERVQALRQILLYLDNHSHMKAYLIENDGKFSLCNWPIVEQVVGGPPITSQEIEISEREFEDATDPHQKITGYDIETNSFTLEDSPLVAIEAENESKRLQLEELEETINDPEYTPDINDLVEIAKLTL